MIVVYSAIFGGSDSLKHAPTGADRCVVFTDDATLAGPGWEVVVHPTPERPRRAARVLKMAPIGLFPDAEASIWLDGSIELRDWNALMLDTAGADIACFAHPDRSTCYDEGATVVRLQIAHPAKVNESLRTYRREGFAPTSLSTTGLFYRRHTPRVAGFNQLWRDQLNAYGTNDQVHVDYCAWKTGVTVTHLRGHYRDNPYAVYDKADHHRRRKPQFKLEAECDNYLA